MIPTILFYSVVTDVMEMYTSVFTLALNHVALGAKSAILSYTVHNLINQYYLPKSTTNSMEHSKVLSITNCVRFQ